MLRVSGKNFSIGEAMREHIEARIEAAAHKYFGGAVNGHVIVDHEGSGYRAECTLHLASGVTLHSEGRAQDPYPAFDHAADRLDKRLSRYKSRIRRHHGNGASASEDIETIRETTLEAPAHDEEHESDAFNPIVIAERSHGLKQMPVSEAVIELDFTGTSVLVFRHATSGRVNVLYRRPDGNIGWLDPAALEARREP